MVASVEEREKKRRGLEARSNMESLYTLREVLVRLSEAVNPRTACWRAAEAVSTIKLSGAPSRLVESGRPFGLDVGRCFAGLCHRPRDLKL